MKAVIYNPDTGAIAMTIEGSERNIVASATAQRLAWLEVEQVSMDMDMTHVVRDGQAVLKEAR